MWAWISKQDRHLLIHGPILVGLGVLDEPFSKMGDKPSANLQYQQRYQSKIASDRESSKERYIYLHIRWREKERFITSESVE